MKLTKRELEIMNILWASSTPLVASEIAKLGKSLTVNTVQAVVKKLMQSNFIKVADIVYSGTVLSRSYTPTLTKDEFELNNMMDSYKKISNKSLGVSKFVNTLLEEEKNTNQLLADIEQLETLLKAKKETIIKGNK